MRIWIHIGLQKTGTTALQQWCAQNAAHLKENGLLYLQLREGLPACGPLTNALRDNRPELAQMIRHLQSQVAAHPNCQDALLSNEGFCQEDPQLLRPLIEAFEGHEIGFIVTLRRQDRMAEALYKQVVKFNGASASPQDFLQSKYLQLLDYAKLLESWQNTYEMARLLPLIYEEKAADSIALILQALGYAALIPADSHDFRRNITPAAALIAAYQAVPPEKAKALRRANQKLMAAYEGRAAGHDDIFDQATTTTILQQFDGSNQIVLERYFPQRTSLFAPQRPQQAEALNPKILEDFDRLLAKELRRLAKEAE